MTLNLSLVVITISVAAVAGALIFTLVKVNQLLHRATELLDHLNQNIPLLMGDLRSTSSNVNAAAETLSQGIQQAAAGVDYLKSIKLGSVLELVALTKKVLKYARIFIRMRKKQ